MYSVKGEFISELRSRPIFGGSGSDPSKIKRLRLLVNCKAENYEFVAGAGAGAGAKTS